MTTRWQLRVKGLYPRSLVEIEPIDKATIAQYTQIALYEYERTAFQNAGPVNNFLGVAAELAFLACLKELGLKQHKDYEYNDRKPEYWDHDHRKYDFKMKSGTTIEVASAKPWHDHCLIRASEWKKSDYAVSVQIKRFECYVPLLLPSKKNEKDQKEEYRWYKIDANDRSLFPQEITNHSLIEELEELELESIGEAEIIGFGTKEEIERQENRWFYSEKGSPYLTPNYSAYCKRLDAFGPIRELWDKLKPKLRSSQQRLF